MIREPALIIAALGGLITAAIPLLARTFGWTDDVSADWETLANSALILIGALVTAYFIRSQVTPVEAPQLPADTSVLLPEGGTGTVIADRP